MTYEEFITEWESDSPFVHIKTSGSTGAPKHMFVEKVRMLASARMTCDFLGLRPDDTALLCMPLDYIAGKMMVVRAIERGLNLSVVAPSSHPLAGLTKPFDFIAMVPSQVYESLKVPAEATLLAQSKRIIIGGGAISSELQNAISKIHSIEPTPACCSFFSTYGMTETLSHIALRRLNGPDASDWYTPFEGVTITLNDDDCLVINAPYVCKESLITNDIAEIVDGRFRIKGRKDNVICSGGIKVHAEEVEAMLQPHLHRPFYITKKSDARFGEVVVLVTEDNESEFTDIITLCDELLPRYWRPRHIIHVDHLPTTETGKPARRELERLAQREKTDASALWT